MRECVQITCQGDHVLTEMHRGAKTSDTYGEAATETTHLMLVFPGIVNVILSVVVLVCYELSLVQYILYSLDRS